MALKIDALDHLVLTVADMEASLDFYTRVLGMEAVVFAGGRKALAFGDQKINLHQAGREFEPKAARPTPGSADVCLLTSMPLEQVQAHLTTRRAGHRGPCPPHGGQGAHPLRVLPRSRRKSRRGVQPAQGLKRGTNRRTGRSR